MLNGAMIIERIENNLGTAIKYEDGTMICTRVINTTIDCTRSWGNIYIGEDTNYYNYASEFIETPVVVCQVTPSSGTGMYQINYDNVEITKSYYRRIGIARGDSRTGVPVKAHLIAIGKWK